MANYHDIRYDMALPTASSGAMVHIKTLTSDGSDDNLTFVNGASDVVLDNTYKTYIFRWTSIHPETNDIDFSVNFRDGGSAYDASKTTSYFRANQGENASPAALQYETAVDLINSTAVQNLSKGGVGSDNDHSCSGVLHLFNPSSTTFVKHFIARSHFSGHDDQSSDDYIAGYCNTTSAIDGVQFKFASDEIQAGSISMWGIA